MTTHQLTCHRCQQPVTVLDIVHPTGTPLDPHKPYTCLDCKTPVNKPVEYDPAKAAIPY